MSRISGIDTTSAEEMTDRTLKKAMVVYAYVIDAVIKYYCFSGFISKYFMSFIRIESDLTGISIILPVSQLLYMMREAG